MMQSYVRAIPDEPNLRTPWDHVVTHDSSKVPSFLQSWDWGVMQQAYGRSISRFVLQDAHDRWLGVVLCIAMPLPAGVQYLFSPRGPVIVEGDAAASMVEFADAVRQHGGARTLWWRYEPLDSVFSEPRSRVVHVHDVEPSTTLLLDLSQDSAHLLAVMKQKTRYNIRVAKKYGVEVRRFSQEERPDWKVVAARFWELIVETGERHKIRTHPRGYYETMIATLGAIGMVEMWEASVRGVVVAMNMMLRYGNTMTYLHGAATHRHKEVKAPTLLQWEAVQHAQTQGLRWYDFYGVASTENATHSLAAVTRFKEGFGGERYIYPGTFDVPLRPLAYRVIRLIRSLR